MRDSESMLFLLQWVGFEKFVVGTVLAVSRGPLPSNGSQLLSFVILGHVLSPPCKAPNLDRQLLRMLKASYPQRCPGSFSL